MAKKSKKRKAIPLPRHPEREMALLGFTSSEELFDGSSVFRSIPPSGETNPRGTPYNVENFLWQTRFCGMPGQADPLPEEWYDRMGEMLS